VAPDVPAEPALVAPGAFPLALPPSVPPVLPEELLGPDGAPVNGVLALGLLFEEFEPVVLAFESLPFVLEPFKEPLAVLLGLVVVAPPFKVELGVAPPLLRVEPDVAPLLSDGPFVAPLLFEFDEAPAPLLVAELLSMELEGPFVREDPVELPELLVPAAPPETLVPAPPAEPAVPPPAPPAAPPLPAAAIKKSPPGVAALTPDTGRATRATPASKVEEIIFMVLRIRNANQRRLLIWKNRHF